MSLPKASLFCTTFNAKVNHDVEQSFIEKIYTDIENNLIQMLNP